MSFIQLNNKAAALIISCQPKKATKHLYHLLLKTYDLPENLCRQRPVAPKFNWLDRSNFLGISKEIHAFALEYDEGMRTYHDPLFIHAAYRSPAISNETVRLAVLYNLGIAQMHLGEDEEAFVYFSSLIDLYRATKNAKTNLTESSAVSIVAILNNIGHIHFRAGNYEEALASYEEAVAITRVCHSYYHLDIAATLNSIGVLRLHHISSTEPMEIDHTLGLFVEAHSIRNAIIGHDEDKDTATVLNNIGRIKFMNGDYEMAYDHYSLCCDIRRKVLGYNHLDVAATLNNMAQASSMMKRFNYALELYAEYLDIASEKLGTDHIDIAAAMKSMAETHEDACDLENAILCYKQAISLYQDAEPVDHAQFEVASILNKLGNIYYTQNNVADAINFYRQGLDIERQINDESSRNVAITLLNIARVYKTQGSLDQALSYYTAAAENQEALGKPEALHLACTLSEIGLLHNNSGSHDAAIRAYERALALRKEHLGRSHFTVSITLNALGAVCYKKGALEVAIEYFDECLSIRRESKDCSSIDIATVLFNLASIHVDSGHSGKAIRCFEECIILEKSSDVVKLTNVLSTLKGLGRVYLKRGEANAALKCFNEGVEICRTNDDNAIKAQLSFFLYFVGNCHLALNQQEEAMAAYCDGLRANHDAGIEDLQNLIEFPVDYYLMSKINFNHCAPAA